MDETHTTPEKSIKMKEGNAEDCLLSKELHSGNDIVIDNNRA